MSNVNFTHVKYLVITGIINNNAAIRNYTFVVDKA